MTPNNQNNKDSISVPISYPGAYLFQSPHQLEFVVDKELAVVFCLKGQASTGLVLSDSSFSNRELLSELELLFLKIKSKLNANTKDINLKLFGLSHGANHTLETVYEWAKSLDIKIVASDLGKRLVRNISINCRDGKVGVTYGQINNGPSNLIFLSEGTARTRLPLAKVHNSILILSDNPVQRQLTKAAIEEYPAWNAIIVEDINKFVASKSGDGSNFSVVLCFDEMRHKKGLEKLLINLKKSHPSTQFCWVGASIPELTTENLAFRLLPPIEYELLPAFKKMLKRAVFDSNLAMNFETVKIPAKKRK